MAHGQMDNGAVVTQLPTAVLFRRASIRSSPCLRRARAAQRNTRRGPARRWCHRNKRRGSTRDGDYIRLSVGEFARVKDKCLHPVRSGHELLLVVDQADARVELAVTLGVCLHDSSRLAVGEQHVNQDALCQGRVTAR
jgi:hypothetical protein